MSPQILELTNANTALKAQLADTNKELWSMKLKLQNLKEENVKIAQERAQSQEMYQQKISSQKGENKFLQDRINSMQKLIEQYIG